jgi:hypothetical protein
MKKFTVLALLATFVVAGSLFATPSVRHQGIATEATFLSGSPATTNNDDSCDISVAPAATLLLPYFEVAEDPLGENTLFTITNVSQFPAIAHVVLWTDYSYPVIDFNIYLTGYDVQSISLFDLIWRTPNGVIAPASGPKELGTGTVPSTGTGTGDFDEIEPGSGLLLGNCGTLTGNIPPFYQTRMQTAFTEGVVAGVPGDPEFTACDNVGGQHENAVGYATIDVVNLCTTSLPTDGDTYFATEIRFDNVLIGDYQQVNSGQNFAQGNPMVHIRAVPELNGNPGINATNFDRTFYSRYQTLGATVDRRQPLPSTFAARWINGGTGNFQTSYKIWREGVNIGTDCDTVEDNGFLVIEETIVFDEHENGEGNAPEESDISPVIGPGVATLPETSLTAVVPGSEIFPQAILGTTQAGWMYLNLHNPADPDQGFATQNWVINSLRAEGRFSVDFDAAWLGNGCSPIAPVTSYSNPALPAPGTATTPTPAGFIGPGPAADVTP